MKHGGMGGLLMGAYLGERYTDPGADDWTVIRGFVDGSCPAQGFDASREIDGWLRQPDDEVLLDLYLEKGGVYRPDPRQWTLRECLAEVSAYVLGYSQETVRRAVAEFDAMPPELVAGVVTAMGAEGEGWLRALPGRIDSAARRWSLQSGPRYPSALHYVTAVTRANGSPGVLRLGVPGPVFTREVGTIEAFGGVGAVALLEADLDGGAVLLERAVPGESLSELAGTDDLAATEVVADVLMRLWRPVPSAVPLKPVESLVLPFERYLELNDDHGPVPGALAADAQRVLDELLGSPVDDAVLLHGDLHHDNIRSSSGAPTGWLAIDPKGYCGDRGYDVAAMLYNPMTQVAQVPDLEALLRRRLAVLGQRLGMDEQRLLAWGFVKAVLAEVWFVEDTGTTNGTPLMVAQALRAML